MNGVPWRFSRCASYSGSLQYLRARALGGSDGGQGGRLVYRLAYADIGSAAAEIAVHGCVDVLVGRLRVFGEQGGGGHDLAGLAVAALRHVDFLPGELHGVGAVRRKAFERGDGLSAHRGNGCEAGTD